MVIAARAEARVFSSLALVLIALAGESLKGRGRVFASLRRAVTS